jgi:hypothetical protein
MAASSKYMMQLLSDEAEICFHVRHKALKCLGGVKRAKRLFVLLPGVHFGSMIKNDKVWRGTF